MSLLFAFHKFLGGFTHEMHSRFSGLFGGDAYRIRHRKRYPDPNQRRNDIF
jgi:hypothetical protein